MDVSDDKSSLSNRNTSNNSNSSNSDNSNNNTTSSSSDNTSSSTSSTDASVAEPPASHPAPLATAIQETLVTGPGAYTAKTSEKDNGEGNGVDKIRLTRIIRSQVHYS